MYSLFSLYTKEEEMLVIRLRIVGPLLPKQELLTFG